MGKADLQFQGEDTEQAAKAASAQHDKEHKPTTEKQSRYRLSQLLPRYNTTCKL